MLSTILSLGFFWILICLVVGIFLGVMCFYLLGMVFEVLADVIQLFFGD